jgi:hypothetical protein
MASPYVEDPEDLFDYATDFLEVVDNQSPNTLHMSQDVQEAEVVGWVRANKIRDCNRKLLGFSYAETSNPFGLRRENPQWHPDWPQLRAYDVAVRFSTPEPWNLFSIYPLKRESPFDAESVFTSNYKWSLVTVRYRNFIHRFREDDDIPEPADEWRRNCWVQTDPRVEALTVTGGQSMLRFAESGPGGTPASGETGVPFPAPIAMLLSKKGIVVHWFDGPWEYLSTDEDVFTPTKLDAVVGKVNSDLFMGRYEPGTLLAEAYRYTIGTWPVAPQDALDALRKVTLALAFVFFDPERGAVSPLARGHNLMPWGGTGVGAKPGGDGKFYLATRDGLTTGDRLIPSAAFSGIFTHVSAP